jgi:hypothetical protein
VKEIYQHPALQGLTQADREQIWHAFREQNPNWKWSLTFFGLWLAWCLSGMISAQFISQKYIQGPFSIIGVHLTCTLGIGVIGGCVIIGRVMLPKRMEEFHSFLNSRDETNIMDEQGLQKWDTDQDSGASG